MSNTKPATEVDRKEVEGKPRFSLLPQEQLWAVIAVLEYGARKYEDPNTWRNCEDSTVYIDAAQRHIAKRLTGSRKDPDSGLDHLAHAVTNLMFAMWLDDNKGRK